jgi:hypothetical protein
MDKVHWVPAFAGMTPNNLAVLYGFEVVWSSRERGRQVEADCAAASLAARDRSTRATAKMEAS